MRQLAFTLALALTTLGCTAPTEALTDPASRQLVGQWQSAPETINVVGTGGVVLWSGSWQTTITFAANGDAVVDIRDYGLLPSQRPADVSAYWRISGTFRVNGDSLTIQESQTTWWDGFYGANSPEHVETSAPTDRFYDHAHYAIVANRLTVNSVSYPADAPVPTTATFFRVP